MMHTYHRPPWISWCIWGCAALFYLYQFILRVGPGVIGGDVMNDLHISEAAFGIMTALYSLAYAGVQLPLGMTADRFGTHPILVVGTTLAVLGTFLFAWGDSSWILMVGRFLVGAGSAVGFLSCVKLATVWFPHTYLSRINGLTLTLGTLGATLGGKPFALLSEAVGWRVSLWWVGSAGIGILILVVFLIRDRKTFPPPKAVYSGPQDTFHWLEALRIVARNPTCWWGALYNFLMYVPLAGFADLWGISFLTQVYEVSRPAAAQMCMNIYIGMALGCPFFGWLSEVMKSRRLPMLGASCLAFIFLALIVFQDKIPFLYLELLLLGAGFFIGGKTLGFTYICELTPHALNGTAVGFLNTICMLSGLLIQPLIGGILTFLWRGDIMNGFHAFSHEAYMVALAAIPLSVLWSVVIMWRLPESYRSEHLR